MTQLGMFGVEESNPPRDEDGDFYRSMRDYARQVCRKRGSVSTDDLRAEAERREIAPRSSNSWGQVFNEDGWRPVGRRASVWPSNHGREVKIWRWEP